MDQVLKGLPFARCYIDNVIIFNDTLEEHVGHLRQVFERLRAGGYACTMESVNSSTTSWPIWDI